MENQINETKRMQELAGLINEAQLKIYGIAGNENSIVDLGLIDTLAQQILPAVGYSSDVLEKKMANIDYQDLIQKIAKQLMGIGTLENDLITFKK